VGESEVASGGSESVARSTEACCWPELSDVEEVLFRVEDVDIFEDCPPRLGVMVTLLFRLGL
jgi:hypothetical protein